jgi:hypothetical protein
MNSQQLFDDGVGLRRIHGRQRLGIRNKQMYPQNKSAIRYLFALFLTVASIPSLAQDDQTCDEKVISHLRASLHIESDVNIRANACIRWGSGQLLAAVALESYFNAKVNQDDLDFYVAVLDRRTFNLISSYKGGSIPDGGGEEVRSESIRFETQPYNLANGISAFGVKITQQSTVRCGEGGSDGQLLMFIPRGRSILPLFSDPLTTHYYQFVGGLPCATDAYATNETKLTVSVAKTKTKGLADLLITVARTEKSEKSFFHLRFSGKNYPIRDLPWLGY